MTRRLLNVLTLLSLLLCVAVMALWVRSSRKAEHFWLNYRGGRSDLLQTDRGDFTIYRSKSPGQRRAALVGFEYGAGPLIGSHPQPGSYPVVRRWGPFSFAALPQPRPPTADELNAARRALAEWERTKSTPPPPKR